MAAGGDDHKAPPLHDIAGGMLVGMPVRDKLPAPLLLGEVIDRGRLDQGVGQYPLDRLARYVAGGKRALQGTCGIAAHGLDPGGFERRAVEGAQETGSASREPTHFSRKFSLPPAKSRRSSRMRSR
jgi:hypothetical protein